MMIYQAIATAFTAKMNCEKAMEEPSRPFGPAHYQSWCDIWNDRVDTLCRERMPSGSGVDCGTTFDWDASKPERLVFNMSFHHMDEHGGYDGWTEHVAIVTPSLQFGFHIRMTGRNRNDIKDYLADILHSALKEELGEWAV